MKNTFWVAVWASFMLLLPAKPPALAQVIMPLGDSVTKGFHGDPAIRGCYRLELEQRFLQNGMVWNFVGEFASGTNQMIDRDHQAVGGRRIEAMIGNNAKAVGEFDPDIILIVAGTNNRNDPLDYYEFRAKYQALVDMIREKAPDAKIVFSTLPKIGYGPRFSDNYVTYINQMVYPIMNKALSDVARNNGLTVVDWYETFNEFEDLTDDQVHPNKYGHAKLGKLFFHAILDL